MAVDLALNNNDIFISGGDFSFAESDMQHIIDTINAFPGWWKENPADGVGIMLYMKSSGAMTALNRNIKIQLQSDGFDTDASVITLDTAGNLIINPNAIVL